MNKTLITIVLLAVIAGAILFFLGVFQLPFLQADELRSTSGVDEDTFIEYKSPLGFSLSHPFWFKREDFNNASDPLKLRLTATSEGLAEAVQVYAFSDSVENLKNELKSGLTAEEKSTLVEYEAFNAKMMRMEVDSDIGGMIVQNAVFSCSGYNAVLTAAVPWEMEEDLRSMNAIAKSFKC